MSWVSMCVFFFKQKTAYELRISDWSSDVCSSDLAARFFLRLGLFSLFEGHRLLRFQHRFRNPRIAAIDTGDRIVVGQIIESRGAFRAATFRAPFSLYHISLVTFWKQDRNFGRRTATCRPNRQIGEIGRASCREKV